MVKTTAPPKLSVLSDAQKHQLAEIVVDPWLYIQSNLYIADKYGRCVRLTLNEQQKRLFREIERQEKLGLPVRIIILKARQIGFSTAIAAWLYYKTVTRPLANTMIVAHQADASSSIFEKMKMFYEHSNPFLAPMRKASNAKELIFGNPSTNGLVRRDNPGLNSKIEIETAVSKDVGRSKTLHHMHLSELAFWLYPEETLKSALQAVPNLPNTTVIIESTANGVGGEFYKRWKDAEQGLSAFVPMFFPWHEHNDYTMTAPDDFEPTPDEAELREQFDLTDGQLTWRRWCIANNCGGSLETFQQEYPMTPDEAFIASGRPVFDVKALDLAQREAPEPKKIGRVERDTQNNIKFNPMYNGYLKVWEFPQDGREYVIGIDVAEGKINGDFSCMQVLRKDTKEQVAEWHGHIDPDLLGKEAAELGLFYNMALVIPENNSMGIATVLSLQRHRYPRIYRNRTEEKVKERISYEYGFRTVEKSKKQAVTELQKIIRESASRIKSKWALSECMTFVFDEKGKMGAQSGCHDDRVMALAIGYHALNYRDFAFDVPPIEEIPIAQLYQANSTTGY